MSNPYKTKEFLQLRSTWYKKIAEGGFYDLEKTLNSRNHVTSRKKYRKTLQKRNYLSKITEKKSRYDRDYLLRTHSHCPGPSTWVDHDNPGTNQFVEDTPLTIKLDILSYYLHNVKKINGVERLIMWYFYHGLNIYTISDRLREYMPTTFARHPGRPNHITKRTYSKQWVLGIIEKHLKAAASLYRIENEEDY